MPRYTISSETESRKRKYSTSTSDTSDSDTSSQSSKRHCAVHKWPRKCPTKSRKLIKNMDNKIILRGKYHLRYKLGSGGFGVTYHAKDVKYESPKPAALCAKIQPLGCSEERETIDNEVNMLKKVTGHEYVVNFRGFFADRYYAYLIMDYYSGPTLYEVIKKGYMFDCGDSLSTLKGIFLQILDGVEFIHSRGIAHHDLKPKNIIVDDFVKIIDFGLATDQRRMSGIAGTYDFMAAEIFKSAKYDSKMVDNWSLGIILLHMLAGSGAWLQANKSDERYL